MAKPLLSNTGQEKKRVREGDKITEYFVRGVEYSANQLEQELEMLEFNIDKPSEQELIEYGKSVHPYYTQQDNSARIAEIKGILGIE